MILGDQRLNNDGNERNKMLQQIVDVSRIDNGKLVFMGHSRGCPDTLRICAENKVFFKYNLKVFGKNRYFSRTNAAVL